VRAYTRVLSSIVFMTKQGPQQRNIGPLELPNLTSLGWAHGKRSCSPSPMKTFMVIRPESAMPVKGTARHVGRQAAGLAGEGAGWAS